jgi:ubiquinone/menaquinone biosynthesis C-methylase UbiE
MQTTANAVTQPTPDLAALKSRQQVGARLQIVGESLCEALDLRSGEKVLDIAAGNGNATLAAARRWAEVTSTDYVPELLERGRERAMANGLAVEFQQADAEALPFKDASFDVVVSTFGVMFTPDQDKAAKEMLRVCRPGGRIGMANWTPESFIGQVFKTIGKHIPPMPGLRSPALWGTKARLEEMFGGQASIEATSRMYNFRYRSPAHWLEVFRTWYGPVHKAFEALPQPGKAALEEDFLALIARFNRAKDGTMVVPAEYLEVVIRKG